MTLLAIALVTTGQAASASPEVEDPFEAGDEAEAAPPAEAPAPSRAASSQRTTTKASKAKSKVASRSKARVKRTRSRTGARIVGHVVPEGRLRATPPPRPSGNLHLYMQAHKESLRVNIYNSDGSYDVEALRQVSRLLRCRRTDSEKDIEPRLLTILSHVYDRFGERRLEVVSAFRNQRRMSSYHYKAAATDIRIQGVRAKDMVAFLDSIDAGGMGVGLYPRTGFVHVDVRPLPSYRWTDWSRSDPNAPDKRPPRGWRKKRVS